MSDLINRQAAISTVFSICCRWDTDDMDDLKNMLMRAFQDLPSADRPTGEWNEDKRTEAEHQLVYHKVWSCSNCGEKECRPKPTNFCPNCGTKMEK